jgi:tRNA (guanine26-N2/guanine27-N2)-dimethyltransferase
MAGCGVRSLRYWREAGADWLWVNEGNPDLATLLQANLREAIAHHQVQLTHQDANRLFFDCYNRKDYYDLVDVDCFGAASPQLSTCLWATALGGLIYLTSTDGRTATGHLPEQSLGCYAAYARSHPAAHEQALRLLLGSFQQQAAHRNLGILPKFAFYTGQTYRVMVQLQSKPQLHSRNYGFLGYCHHCGSYETFTWRQLGRSLCPQDKRPMTVSGPLWLGELHDRAFLDAMIAQAQKWQNREPIWTDRVALLQLMQAESAMPPYFYRLGEIGRHGHLDIPKRSHLIQALQAEGYTATETHIDAQAIKTTAPFPVCVAIARQEFNNNRSNAYEGNR